MKLGGLEAVHSRHNLVSEGEIDSLFNYENVEVHL